MSVDKLHRSALYVPASNPRAIAKIASIPADWIIIDLEDSVAAESKSQARKTLMRVFEERDFGNSRIAIRCNAVGDSEFPADLDTVAICCPDALLIPKVSTKAQVELFAAKAKSATLDSRLRTWFMIETASGIAQLESIVVAGSELTWDLSTLVVGHNDIASETGVSLDENRRYMIPWLMQIVLRAKQFDLRVLDSVWNNFRDQNGFEAEALQARKMGFDGKTLIHPTQVVTANKSFSPSTGEIERAKKIIDAFLRPENEASNVINIDGEMVERLHLSQAQKLLEKFPQS